MDVLLNSPLTAVIVACEVGFWLLLAAGLATRYALRKPKAGAVLLALVPVVDLVLLVVTVLDLLGGAKPSALHGLAAVYLGFSMVFGPSMVRWADVRFAHRFSGGPAPVKPSGAAKTRHEWREWGKCVLACAISAGLLLLAILIVDSAEQAAPLWGWLPKLGTLTAIWFLVGPLWQQVFGPAGRSDDNAEARR